MKMVQDGDDDLREQVVFLIDISLYIEKPVPITKFFLGLNSKWSVKLHIV